MGKSVRHRSGGQGCGCGIGCGCGCCRGGPVARCFLTLLNTAFLISGVAAVYFGIWSKVERKYTSLQDIVASGVDYPTLSNAWAIILCYGLFVALVSMLGCVAVCSSRRRNCLVLYAFLLFLILVCGLVASVVYGVNHARINNDLKSGLTKSLQDYKPGNQLAKNWDTVQAWVGCCGSKGPNDYRNVTLKNMDMHVPVTCCVLTNNDPEHPSPQNGTECQSDAYKFQHGNITTSTVLQTTGCYDSIRDYINSKLGIIIGVAVAMSVLQMFGVCLSIGSMRDSSYDYGGM